MSVQEVTTTKILTLDAGGTNFVFHAISNFKEVGTAIHVPAHADNLELCLQSIISGFEQLAKQVGEFSAISFAFPGPANYALGIIENLPNFKAFNGGVALGPMLEEHFKVPVFINNDGNLFASGVAHAGYLPTLNKQLAEAGSKKQFQNLIGITLGTGFGCGIVTNGQMLIGDNSCGGEIHSTINGFNPAWNAEESVSTRAIQRVYAEESETPFSTKLMPKDIYEIAKGKKEGDVRAANSAFAHYGKALGSSIVNILSLIDGIVVIGGGLSASWDLFSPAMFMEINRQTENFKNEKMNRLSCQVFNLEDSGDFDRFTVGELKTIQIPGTDKIFQYDALQRTGIALSKIDGSLATSLGAYAFAVQKLAQ